MFTCRSQWLRHNACIFVAPAISLTACSAWASAFKIRSRELALEYSTHASMFVLRVWPFSRAKVVQCDRIFSQQASEARKMVMAGAALASRCDGRIAQQRILLYNMSILTRRSRLVAIATIVLLTTPRLDANSLHAANTLLLLAVSRLDRNTSARTDVISMCRLSLAKRTTAR